MWYYDEKNSWYCGLFCDFKVCVVSVRAGRRPDPGCGTPRVLDHILRGDIMSSVQVTKKDIADQTGYSTNASHLVAIVINDICNPHYTFLISEIEEYLRQAGYDILILWSSKEGDENQTGEHSIQLAAAQSVDGILYFPYQYDHASIELMKNCKIPYVLVDRKIEDIDTDMVCCDDYAGGQMAALHLLSLGHRSFLYLQGPAYSSSQTDRERGFIDTLRYNKIPETAIHFLPDEILQQPAGSARLARMLKKEGITAALAFRDEVAYLAINQLEKEGMSVPDDLSIIGFDHLHAFFPYLKPLTSVFCSEEYSIGRSAAQLLLRRIGEKDAETKELIFPVKLYEEGTTRELRRKTPYPAKKHGVKRFRLARQWT